MTKVEKAVNLLVKNPNMSAQALAAKVGYQPSNAAALKAKCLEKMAMTKKPAAPEGREPVSATTQRGQRVHSILIDESPTLSLEDKDWVTIRIPRKSLTKQLFGDALKGFEL